MDFNLPFGVKDGILRIHSHLILGSISNEPFGICESGVARRCPVTLVIGNDLDLSVLIDADTGVGSTQVNPDSGAFLRGNWHFRSSDNSQLNNDKRLN